MPESSEESTYCPVWSLSSQPVKRTSQYTLNPPSGFFPPDYSTISALEMSHVSSTPRSGWGYSPGNLEVSSPQPSQVLGPLIDGYIVATFGPPSTSSLFTALLSNPVQDKLYCGIHSHHSLGFFVTDTPAVRRPQPHDRPLGYNAQVTTPCGRQTVSIDYRYLSTANANLGMVIPQRLWEARTPSAKSKHANKAPGNLSAPIFFIPADCNDRIGIPFADALAGTGSKLRGSDQSVDMGASSTNIHIMWEGYEDSKRQVQLRQCRGGVRPPITLETLAKFIARSIDLFFQKAKRDPNTPLSDCWSIEAGNVQKERILIIGLIQTSLGGWQPILQTF